MVMKMSHAVYDEMLTSNVVDDGKGGKGDAGMESNAYANQYMQGLYNNMPTQATETYNYNYNYFPLNDLSGLNYAANDWTNQGTSSTPYVSAYNGSNYSRSFAGQYADYSTLYQQYPRPGAALPVTSGTAAAAAATPYYAWNMTTPFNGQERDMTAWAFQNFTPATAATDATSADPSQHAFYSLQQQQQQRHSQTYPPYNSGSHLDQIGVSAVDGGDLMLNGGGSTASTLADLESKFSQFRLLDNDVSNSVPPSGSGAVSGNGIDGIDIHSGSDENLVVGGPNTSSPPNLYMGGADSVPSAVDLAGPGGNITVTVGASNSSAKKSYAKVASQPARGSAATMAPSLYTPLKRGVGSGTGSPMMSSTVTQGGGGGGFSGATLAGGSGALPNLSQQQHRSGSSGVNMKSGGSGASMSGGGGGGSSNMWLDSKPRMSNNSAVTTGASPPGPIVGDETDDGVDLDSEARRQQLAKTINPRNFDINARKAKFFVIKSYSEDDVHRSIKYSIWCSTESGNKRLDSAFNEMNGTAPVYLFFSVNGSGHFCGMAEMVSKVDYYAKTGVWSQDKWKGKFTVKWIFVKDVPNNLLRHIRIETNENKPVTNSRDATEIPFEKGRMVMKVMANYRQSTSIFDDFLHYERRERQEGKKA